MFFWDQHSQTFINVADNDKSVLISYQKQKNAVNKHKIVLKLFDTNRYAPGPHPFHYGGFTKRQFVTNDRTNNILCYKFLNNYSLKSEQWVKSQSFNLRHHKNCNFDFFYINIDPHKLRNRRRWREIDDDESMSADDDKRERENEEVGDEAEKEFSKDQEDGKGSRNNNCGCCCDEAVNKKKYRKEKADKGEPDDDDDVSEVPKSHHPRPTISPGTKRPDPPIRKP